MKHLFQRIQAGKNSFHISLPGLEMMKYFQALRAFQVVPFSYERLAWEVSNLHSCLLETEITNFTRFHFLFFFLVRYPCLLSSDISVKTWNPNSKSCFCFHLDWKSLLICTFTFTFTFFSFSTCKNFQCLLLSLIVFLSIDFAHHSYFFSNYTLSLYTT